ncbi:MAG: hypothetical protein AAGF50_05895 [Pseudomonadota bacterium]
MKMNDRLKLARQRAGFATAAEAANAFGWKYPTYAGHENSTRGFRVETGRQYAIAFRVNEAWLMLGRGEMVSSVNGQLNYTDMSFSEKGVTWSPLVPKEDNYQKDISLESDSIYSVSIDVASAFAIPFGSRILLDVKSRPLRGDLVVFDVIDDDLGAAYSYLGRYLPPYIIGPGFSQDPENSKTELDPNITIRGKAVIATED